MDPDCEPLADYLFPAAKILDPFGLENMRYKWRKWLIFDCNWKVAMEAFNETYHVFTTHPEFNKFGEFNGWAKAQGRHSNIGYDAPKGLEETKSKIRLGTGDPRISTAEMQVYTMEETNATTTQTLVDAAKRLVDELPEGTPADKVLEHWLASARRDDDARGVVWPTIPADILGQSGTAWQIFPNFQIGQGLTSALCYSARPDPATTRTSASSRSRSSSCIPKGKEPQTEWEYTPVGDPNWLSVLPQDFSNMAAVQQGMKSLGFPGTKPNPYRERSTVNLHTNWPSTWAPANPRGAHTEDQRDDDRTETRCGHRRRRPTTSTSTRCGRSTCHERDKRLRDEGQSSTWSSTATSRSSTRPIRTRRSTPRDPISEDIDVAVLGGGFAGPARRAPISKKAGVDDVRDHRPGRRLRRRLVLEPLPGHPVRQRRLLLYTAARRARLHAEQEVRRRRRDLRALPADRQALRTLRRRDLLAPRSARWLGRVDQALADHAPTAATTSAPASSSWRRARSTGRSCRDPRHQGLPGPHLPLGALGLRLHRRRHERRAATSSPTSGSRSSARAPPASRCVPHLGRDAQHLYVFQRTPSSVDERGNTPTDPEWVKSLKPGWQKERQRNFHTAAVRGVGARPAGPGLRLLDRAQPQHCARASGAMEARPRWRRAVHGASGKKKTTRSMERLRAPRRQPRRGHGDRRGAEALLPLPVQAAVLQRRLPAHLQPART